MLWIGRTLHSVSVCVTVCQFSFVEVYGDFLRCSFGIQQVYVPTMKPFWFHGIIFIFDTVRSALRDPRPPARALLNDPAGRGEGAEPPGQKDSWLEKGTRPATRPVVQPPPEVEVNREEWLGGGRGSRARGKGCRLVLSLLPGWTPLSPAGGGG